MIARAVALGGVVLPLARAGEEKKEVRNERERKEKSSAREDPWKTLNPFRVPPGNKRRGENGRYVS